MKIKLNHEREIREGIENEFKKLSFVNFDELVSYYEINNIGKNKTISAVYDLFARATINNMSSCQYTSNVLYNYCNDTHIKTCLLNIAKNLYNDTN